MAWRVYLRRLNLEVRWSRPPHDFKPNFCVCSFHVMTGSVESISPTNVLFLFLRSALQLRTTTHQKAGHNSGLPPSVPYSVRFADESEAIIFSR
jgi:hypothetical protein